jgi:hypothetical protein
MLLITLFGRFVAGARNLERGGGPGGNNGWTVPQTSYGGVSKTSSAQWYTPTLPAWTPSHSWSHSKPEKCPTHVTTIYTGATTTTTTTIDHTSCSTICGGGTTYMNTTYYITSGCCDCTKPPPGYSSTTTTTTTTTTTSVSTTTTTTTEGSVCPYGLSCTSCRKCTSCTPKTKTYCPPTYPGYNPPCDTTTTTETTTTTIPPVTYTTTICCNQTCPTQPCETILSGRIYRNSEAYGQLEVIQSHTEYALPILILLILFGLLTLLALALLIWMLWPRRKKGTCAACRRPVRECICGT